MADRLGNVAARLFKHADRNGVDRPAGITYDEIDRSGAPRKAGSKRLWPQTEALKAHLVIDRVDESLAAADASTMILEMMFEHYLKSNGTWQDQLDANNQGVGTSAPASTMYHVVVALDEYLRRFEDPNYRLG